MRRGSGRLGLRKLVLDFDIVFCIYVLYFLLLNNHTHRRPLPVAL